MKGRGQAAISELSASSPRKHTGFGAVCAPLVLGQHALKRSWYHLLLYHLQAGTLHPCWWLGARQTLIQGQAAESSWPLQPEKDLSHLAQRLPNTRPPRGFPRLRPWGFWPKRAGVEPERL